MRKAVQTHQISFKADSRNVRHAEKCYTAGVLTVRIFWQSTGPIIGIREPTPFIANIILRHRPVTTFKNVFETFVTMWSLLTSNGRLVTLSLVYFSIVYFTNY